MKQAVSLLFHFSHCNKKPLTVDAKPRRFRNEEEIWRISDPLVSASSRGHVGVVRLLLSKLDEKGRTRRQTEEAER